MPTLEPLVVRTITLDVKKTMATLMVSRNHLLRFMTQARAITHLATEWIDQAFGVPVDGELGGFGMPHPTLNLRASVRTFNRGRILFQQSKRTGVRRDEVSSRADMIADVERIDYYFVCDLRHFPRVDIYPIRTVKILNFIHGHDVGKNGITPVEFDQFINQNFEVEYRDYDHQEYSRRQRRNKKLGAAKFPTMIQVRR